MPKNFILILIISILGITNIKAQQVFEGKVVEKGTNTPIEFANLGIAGTFVGAATDEAGKFKLNIPAEHKNKKIKISAIGYAPLEVSISTSNLKIIELSKASYAINEVTVDATSLLLVGRIKNAIKKIETNYTNVPYNMTGDYTQTINTGAFGGTTSTGELMIYDNTGYKKQTLGESFKSIFYKFTQYSTSKVIPPTKNGLSDVDFLLEMDLVRLQNMVLNENTVYLYNLTSAPDTVLNGEKVWSIRFTTATPTLATTGDPQAFAMEGYIYIGQKTSAIHKISYHCSSTYWNLNGKSLYCTGKSDYKAKNINYIFETDYAPAADTKMQLKSITMRCSYTDSNNAACNEASQLNIKSIRTAPVHPISGRNYWVEQ